MEKEYRNSIGVHETIRKEMDNMSFVGIFNTMNGLIAFGDCKATRIFNDGHLEKDTKRGTIQKVFKNNKFIVVTYGNNELFSLSRLQNMEDYFSEHLTPDILYDDFFRELSFKLSYDKPEHHSGIYHFIVGAKDTDDRYYICQVIIDAKSGKLEISEKDFQKHCVYAGNDKYVKLFDNIPTYFDEPIDANCKRIKCQIEKMVEIFDEDPHYNPVGLPILVKMLE